MACEESFFFHAVILMALPLYDVRKCMAMPISKVPQASLVSPPKNLKLWLLHLQAVLHRSDKAGFTWSSP
jgi:hypothetical protein